MKIRRLIVMALACMLMVSTVPVDLFAATAMEIQSETEMMTEDIDDLTELSTNSATKTARVVAGSSASVKIGTFAKNSTIKYTIKWTPGATPLYTAFYRNSFDDVTLTTGGIRSYTKTITTTGTYYLYIENRSSSGVDVTITIEEIS